jgi:hypothetical protein
MTPAEWLDQQENISGSLDITMFAMGRSWKGAVYTVEDSDQCIYLLGRMPINAVNLCFRFENDDRDWFVGTYFQEDQIEPQYAKYHPFGKTWTLHPWDHEEAIDAHQDKKCKRIPASIK